ncbi:MAG: hypothetical protein DLD55_00515 [candidate division SR1 bacterium]|nr:MAG: hypothetical protein DLD55_00515 [candidate division SR1 bacterium]
MIFQGIILYFKLQLFRFFYRKIKLISYFCFSTEKIFLKMSKKKKKNQRIARKSDEKVRFFLYFKGKYYILSLCFLLLSLLTIGNQKKF